MEFVLDLTILFERLSSLCKWFLIPKMTRYRLYGVSRVYGMLNGFGGFKKALNNPEETVVELTPDRVDDIHHQGGTILRSARGGFDADSILKWCLQWKVNQIYVVGGDGSHRGANALFEEIQKRVYFFLFFFVLFID